MPVTAGTRRREIEAALDDALRKAANNKPPKSFPEDVAVWIGTFSSQVDQQATSAFNNIITCLAANAADATCDPRYHRPPTGGMPRPPRGRTHFTGRGISEQIVYPWLARHRFRGSMSGWQTRVFERENPYTMDYRENISRVKIEFLSILDAVANERVKAVEVLAAFFRLELAELLSREQSAEWLAKHGAANDVSIMKIIEALAAHFKLPRSARLPVLAIQSIYVAMMPHIARYSDLTLSELSEHSAADENTGAIGDIEVKDADGDVFEGVEVKHGVVIDDNVVRRSCEKVKHSTASRYYILSTSPRVTVTDDGMTLISSLQREHGCQLVINGVLPTIKYYLRLLDKPADFLDAYQGFLVADRRVTREQQDAWKKIFLKMFSDN